MNLNLSSQAQNDLDKITSATLELMKDAQTTGWTTADGLFGFGLENVAKLLFPLQATFRNSVPRKLAKAGSAAARWKAIVGFGYTRTRPTQPFGQAGSLVTTVEQDFIAPYQALSLGDTVQMDAQTLARGFDNLRAKSSIKTLYELMIGEDIIALGGQAFALTAPTAPTLTFSTTSGAINVGVAGTWKIGVAVRTLEGYHYGTPLVAGEASSTAGVESSVTTAVTTAGSIVADCASVPGGFCYDWYVDNGAGGALFYYGTTTINTITFTAAAPTTNPVMPAVDTSADVNSFNGFAATLVGDYSAAGLVQRGTGTRASGSTITSLDGATLTGVDGSISQLDSILLSLAQNYQFSPTRFLMNPQEAMNITNKIFATGGYRIQLQVGQKQDRLTGGVFVERYINKALAGQVINIDVDPQIAPGHLFMLTDSLPFPDNTVDSVLEIEAQQDFQNIEYAMSRGAGVGGGPRYDYEVRAIETLKNYFPVGGVLVQNIGNG